MGMKALLALSSELPLAAVISDAQKGLAAWDAAKLADAQSAFDRALVTLLNAPTGTDADALLGGTLSRASAAVWARQEKEASDKLFFGQPHDEADYDEWVLARGAEHEKAARHADAYAL